MNAAIGALLFAIALLGAIGFARGEGIPVEANASQAIRLPVPAPRFATGITLAQTTPNSEWVKQVLRLEYTTFCATVKKPPQQLVDAINAAMKEDPKTWMPVVIWFNAIAEKYQKAGCGDA